MRCLQFGFLKNSSIKWISWGGRLTISAVTEFASVLTSQSLYILVICCHAGLSHKPNIVCFSHHNHVHDIWTSAIEKKRYCLNPTYSFTFLANVCIFNKENCMFVLWVQGRTTEIILEAVKKIHLSIITWTALIMFSYKNLPVKGGLKQCLQLLSSCLTIWIL